MYRLGDSKSLYGEAKRLEYQEVIKKKTRIILEDTYQLILRLAVKLQCDINKGIVQWNRIESRNRLTQYSQLIFDEGTKKYSME